MKLKVVFILLCFVAFNAKAQQNINLPMFKINGHELTVLFSTFDTLEIKIGNVNTATHNATMLISGYRNHGVQSTIISGISGTAGLIFTIQTPSLPTPSFETESVMRCYGHPIDFTPVNSDTQLYYLVPSLIKDGKSGKLYISYRIKDTPSQTAAYYKALNPIPPGTTAALLF